MTGGSERATKQSTAGKKQASELCQLRSAPAFAKSSSSYYDIDACASFIMGLEEGRKSDVHDEFCGWTQILRANLGPTQHRQPHVQSEALSLRHSTCSMPSPAGRGILISCLLTTTAYGPLCCSCWQWHMSHKPHVRWPPGYLHLDIPVYALQYKLYRMYVLSVCLERCSCSARSS
jgi:hypothetical protein